MNRKFIVLMTAVSLLLVGSTRIVVAEEIENSVSVDYATALRLQEEATQNYYAILQAGGQQVVNTQPVTNAQNSNVDAQSAALLAKQQAATQLAIQQQQALNPLAVAQAAQQQALAEAIAAQQQAAGEAQAVQQKALSDAIAAQQKAAAEAQAAQQKALSDAIAAQQQAAAEAQANQQKALQAQQEAALKAQQSALEVANAIQTASLTVPQVDVICDTNCAEKNASLYAKSVPDFVLVDISEQRAIFYKNGLRVISDNCVTGSKNKGYDTTVGIHQIVFKDTNRTLRGSYGEAFVKYWMRFTAGGQGLHDAGWRSNFGNSIYITNGSHGCVNLPRETAKIIFDNSYVGMYVIVEN